MSIDHGDTNKSLGGKRTYTVEEIAKILGIGRTAAYSLVHSGVWACMGYTVLLCFALFKTGSLSKSLFGAH